MLRQPLAINKRDKPIIIYRNGQELAELKTIQRAAEWLKDHLNLDHLKFTTIEYGAYLGESWLHEGHEYRFTTDEAFRREKVKTWKEKGIISSEKVLPTGYWTFFCNPNKWAIDEFLLSGQTIDSFSITSWQKDWFEEGQIGVIRVGHDQRTKSQLQGRPRMGRGIYAIVQINGAPFKDMLHDEFYYTDDRTERYHVPIRYVHSLYADPILLEEWEVEENEYDAYLFEGFQASSMPLNPATFNAVKQMIRQSPIEQIPGQLEVFKDAEELEFSSYREGAVKQVMVNAYERNMEARQECLNEKGYRCVVCEFSFVDVYGSIGKEYIHVHHLKELHTIKEEYEVHPIDDLVPVCPNCHAMLHRRRPAYSVQELKEMITKQAQKTLHS